MAHNVVVLKLGTDVAEAPGGRMAPCTATPTSSRPTMGDRGHRENACSPARGTPFRSLFTVPAKPGKYPFICTFAGHYQAGMKGTLIVKSDRPGSVMLNPCELEIDLFCRGLRLPYDVIARWGARRPPHARRPRLRAGTRDPDRIVAEARDLDERPGRGAVRQRSPYSLRGGPDAYEIHDEPQTMIATRCGLLRSPTGTDGRRRTAPP